MHRNNQNVNALLKDVALPRLYRVRQKFDETRLEDPLGEIRRQLAREVIVSRVKPGMTVAVTAGSRGIDNMPLILHEVVSFLKAQGAEPFIIPAMGSHGGAVAEGQVAVLKALGVTEETMGCPVRSSMETDIFAHLPDGTPVYIDRNAHSADGIVVVNRVKPHTGFRGRYESGLFKMMTVGLGKQKGANMTHGRGRLKMGETIELAGNAFLDNINILFGVALVENSFDRTYSISALTPDEIRTEEPKLLETARALLPRLAIENADVLVVDFMGKNISGAGMDTNITKSYPHGYGISREGRAKRIAVLDLTEQSEGAAVGIGLADVATMRLMDKMDCDTTYPNLLTTGGTDLAKLPMVLDNQRLAIQAAVQTCGQKDPEKIRLLHIRDTLHITEFEISEGLLEEARKIPGMTVEEGPYEWKFDQNGDLF